MFEVFPSKKREGCASVGPRAAHLDSGSWSIRSDTGPYLPQFTAHNQHHITPPDTPNVTHIHTHDELM